VRSADWSNKICAEHFFRVGIREEERRVTRQSQRNVVRQAVSNAVNAIETNFPEPFTRAKCGDSVVDSSDPDLGETCDDGNTTSGDGCSDVCQTEP